MQISILSVDVKTVPTAKGSYQTAELAFKNLTFQGKVEGRKIMSFGASASTFKALSAAPTGSVWDIVVVKNDKGFNDWTSATPAVAGAPEQAPTPPMAGQPASYNKAAAPARSSYETPDERAAKQVYIIRQSNLNAAVAALTPGAKAPLKSDDIFALAKQFENYVLDIPAKEIKAEQSGFDTMQDDSDEVM